MDNKQFDSIVEKRIERIRSMLTSKGKEYASDTDRLHNFKAAARYDNEPPERALWGMLKKHLVSIMDLINTIHKSPPLVFLWDEKIGDAINYFILLEALVVERSNLRLRIDNQTDKHKEGVSQLKFKPEKLEK